DFTIVSPYVSWANQSTAVIALFVASMYLFVAKKKYWIALIPGIFMLVATMTYILNPGIGFGLPLHVPYIAAAIIAVILVARFFRAAIKARGDNIPLEEDVSHWGEAA